MISNAEAKMIGITPAWLTLIGKKWRCPPYTRRPRVCLACWIGIRRCDLVMNTTATTAIPHAKTNSSRLW